MQIIRNINAVDAPTAMKTVPFGLLVVMIWGFPSGEGGVIDICGE